MTELSQHDESMREICDVGSRLYDRGLIAGSEGNLSVRLDDQNVICTPTGRCKGRLDESSLCVLNLDGSQVAGSLRPSTEILLHLTILRQRPDIHAVVHAHPPYATAWAIADRALPRGVTAEAEVFLGDVPCTHYQTPGTVELAEAILPFVHSTQVCLLGRHGSVTYAETLEQALHLTEMLESYAHTLFLAEQLGKVNSLPCEELARLQAIRSGS